MKKLIDDTDKKIIKLLQKNGRLTNTEIAKELGVTEGAIRKRLNRLVREKIIIITAVLNLPFMGYSVSGNMRIRVDIEKSDQIISKLKKFDEVWYLTRIIGGSMNLQFEFVVQSFEDYNIFMAKLSKIKGIQKIDQVFYTEELKETYAWDLLLKTKEG